VIDLRSLPSRFENQSVSRHQARGESAGWVRRSRALQSAGRQSTSPLAVRCVRTL